ncbi:MAG: serine acetyltransferase [Gemmatimonadetes bacterium]|nr:serine acetyltransferase [Gemmatimonadota bacterium]
MSTPPDPAWLAEIADARRAYPFPRTYRLLVKQVARTALGILFPHYHGAEVAGDPAEVARELATLRSLLVTALAGVGPEPAERLADRFLAELPAIRTALLRDAEAIRAWDPAAENLHEVLLAYPGFFAIAVHRMAHSFYRMRVKIFPRLLAAWVHARTAIDIHPGAQVGDSFAIDHGTGIVIGESATIGDRVKIYQGVTLGALSVSKALAGAKRHPTIGNDVVIYAGATILGGKTEIGDGSVIGGNTWITASVPARSVVTHQDPVTRAKPADPELLDFVI